MCPEGIYINCTFGNSAALKVGEQVDDLLGDRVGSGKHALEGFTFP